MQCYFLRAALLGMSLATACTPISPDPHQAFLEVRREVRCRVGEEIAKPRRCVFCCSDGPGLAICLDEPLTLQTVMGATLLQNHRLHAIYESLGIAQAELAQAALLKNPVLDLSWKIHHGESIVEVGLVQNLLDLLLKPQKVRAAQAHLESVKTEVSLQILSVIFEAKRAFYAYLAAGEKVRLAKEREEVSCLIAEVMERLADAGNVPPLEILREKGEYIKDRVALHAAKAQWLEAKEDLKVVMGLRGDSDFMVTGEVTPTCEQGNGDDWVDYVTARSLQLLAARQRACEAANRYGIEICEQRFGEVAVGGAAERESSGEWFVGPQLSGSVPIFDWGGVKATGARAALRQLRLEYLALREETWARARVTAARLDAAFARCEEFTQNLIPLAQEELAQRLFLYNAMQIGVPALLKAKKSEVEIREQALSAYSGYWMARLEMEVLTSGGWHD